MNREFRTPLPPTRGTPTYSILYISRAGARRREHVRRRATTHNVRSRIELTHRRFDATAERALS